ncbi:hypothetical protein BDZ94DRAFT_257676 [Collybia nuda]|uniref:Uncharacterized protein n=1 Tax=Collybia nuda TaxID=64659 RepID=A0A9P5XT32_9AGAR|nr:hypothetical protein BDZ94DRAFT_257676 [Collybia nuda]
MVQTSFYKWPPITQRNCANSGLFVLILRLPSLVPLGRALNWNNFSNWIPRELPVSLPRNIGPGQLLAPSLTRCAKNSTSRGKCTN